jgi:hypothetical protein
MKRAIICFELPKNCKVGNLNSLELQKRFEKLSREMRRKKETGFYSELFARKIHNNEI